MKEIEAFSDPRYNLKKNLASAIMIGGAILASFGLGKESGKSAERDHQANIQAEAKLNAINEQTIEQKIKNGKPLTIANFEIIDYVATGGKEDDISYSYIFPIIDPSEITNWYGLTASKPFRFYTAFRMPGGEPRVEESYFNPATMKIRFPENTDRSLMMHEGFVLNGNINLPQEEDDVFYYMDSPVQRGTIVAIAYFKINEHSPKLNEHGSDTV